LSIKIKHLAIFFCFFDRLGKISVHKWGQLVLIDC
jgi:hypothetical protein